MRLPLLSMNPNSPLRTASTATSASAPTPRCPSSGRLMISAAFAVLARITSLIGMPSTSSFDITFRMSFMPAFMLPVCRSVLITSGQKPCFVAGTACRNTKLPPPCPTSKSTPRLRAASTYGSTCPCAFTIGSRSLT